MASNTRKAKAQDKRKLTKSGKNRKRAIRSAVRKAAEAKKDIL